MATRPLVLLALGAAVSGQVAHALDLGSLLASCPQSDPAYQRIRSDLEIRRNGVRVRNVPCREPITRLPASRFTNELIVFQTLRAIFYTENRLPLPWTSLTLYDWMTSKIGGFNISDRAENASCCDVIGGKAFVALPVLDQGTRELYRDGAGFLTHIGLFGHEVRHVDGFPHVSCCGTVGACDQTYDETNLSARGVQWWLHAHYLSGELYLGLSCLDSAHAQETAEGLLQAAEVVRTTFCDSLPPVVSIPTVPGGECQASAEQCPSANARRCTSAKLRAASKATTCLLRLEGLHADRSTRRYARAARTCKQLMEAAFSRQEARSVCDTVGEAVDLEPGIEAFSADLRSGLALGSRTKCQGKKFKSASTNASCLLALEAKAASKGMPRAAGEAEKCVSRLEAAFVRYEASGRCVTVSDAMDVARRVEGFVDDVVHGLCAAGPSDS